MSNPETIFLNLIPCDRPEQPFVDGFAQFGVLFEPGRALGPGTLQMRSCVLTAQPADALLQCWISASAEPEAAPVVRQTLTHQPWTVCETGEIDLPTATLHVRAEHIFIHPRVLLSRFTFSSDHDQPLHFDLAYHGLATGDRYGPTAAEQYKQGLDNPRPPRINRVACQQDRVTGTLEDPAGILPQPRFVIRWRTSDALTAACGPQPFWMGPLTESQCETAQPTPLAYALRSMVTLAPGTTITHQLTTNLTVATAAVRSPETLAWDPAALDFEKEREAARTRFLQHVAWERPPTTAPVYRRKAWRARWALLRTGYQADGNGGIYGHEIASTCVPNHWGFTRNFFWDGLFTSAALTRFHPDFVRGAIRTVLARQDLETGYCPEHSHNYALAERSPLWQPQAPVISWAVARHLECHPDDLDFLAELYPRMWLNHQHWLQRADRDGDGLMEWQWGGQTADNSPLYDRWTNGQMGWLGPQASVHLNAFLHRDAMTLADFAERLNKPEDAANLRAQAQAREALFFKICYLPDEHRFFDYCHLTARHVRVKTFYLFWPIWAGMAVPAETQRVLIEEVLLDPRQFFGPVPFPSVAYDEPTYDENGYWRGKCWPHISYWLMEMLHNAGYPEAAVEAGRRLLTVWLRDPAFPENMRTDPHMFGAHHQPDYNWGAAFASLLLEGPHFLGGKSAQQNTAP